MTLTDLHLKILLCMDGKMQWVHMPWNKQVLDYMKELIEHGYIEKRENNDGVMCYCLTQLAVGYLSKLYEDQEIVKDSQTD